MLRRVGRGLVVGLCDGWKGGKQLEEAFPRCCNLKAVDLEADVGGYGSGRCGLNFR